MVRQRRRRRKDSDHKLLRWLCWDQVSVVKMDVEDENVVAFKYTGGHTSELLNLIKHLDPKKYRPLHLVRANTDIMSHDRSRAELNRSWILRSHEIPRSREVGQSWFSTMFSTVRAIMSCVVLVFRVQPDVLFCNGPGTCVPVCFGCLLLRFLGLGRGLQNHFRRKLLSISKSESVRSYSVSDRESFCSSLGGACKIIEI